MKERLIGAAVLVALGVWLIPWVLDGSPEPSESRSASLQLPISEEPVAMRSQTIRLDDRNDPPGSATADARTQPPANEPPVAALNDTHAKDPAPVVAAATERQAAHTHMPMPAEQAAVPAADPKPAQPKSAEPKPAQAATAAPAPSRPSAAASAVESGWLVQLGSFSEEENARRLAQRVGTFGFKADISNVRASGRTMYRVRVGPHESRERADAAASALSAHGFVAQVVAAD